jgi:hypothetical protein
LTVAAATTNRSGAEKNLPRDKIIHRADLFQIAFREFLHELALG